MSNESIENELYNKFTIVENIIWVIGFLKGMINEELIIESKNSPSIELDKTNNSNNENDKEIVIPINQTKTFNESTLQQIRERVNIALNQTLRFKRKLDKEKLELVLDLYDYKELKKRKIYNSRSKLTYIGEKKSKIRGQRTKRINLSTKKSRRYILVEKIGHIKEKDSLIKLIDSEYYYINQILAYTQILMQMESITKNQILFLIYGVRNLITKLESEKDNEFQFIWNFGDDYPIGLKLVYVLGFLSGIKKTLIVDENFQKIIEFLDENILDLNTRYNDENRFDFLHSSYMDKQSKTYYEYYANYEEDYDDGELRLGNNLRYDSSANPWVDVFGPGDEAEMAYWNTD